MGIGSPQMTALESSLDRRLHGFVTELYPLCRSITGEGLRETLRRIREQLPLEIYEVSSGTKVFDWTVPKEWNIRDAYVIDSHGQRIIDFRKSNLHVVNYSIPVHKKLSFVELRSRLHTLPEHPDWIPYRTSYYKEDWGFCLSHNHLLQMKDEEYEVCIDSSLEDGSLSYGEFYKRGASEDEVLISAHTCHPSLCNDNLSGLAVAVFLAQHLQSLQTRYSYRFLFMPVTIGAITWLARNESQVAKIKHGLILTCLGDSGSSTYKKSRRATAEIDRIVEHVLRHSGQDYNVVEFSPLGYDERQFSSPAFDLPIGCMMRTPNGRFPEYHTSADNLDFVKPSALADSLSKCLAIVEVLEKNLVYRNRNPKCEPQLGRRGLYRAIGGQHDQALLEQAILWLLNFSDGRLSLLEIADRAGMPFSLLRTAAELLLVHDLIEECAAGRIC
jgi:aminopeptidase-like protein